MSFGKINKHIEIISTTLIKDSEDFVTRGDTVLSRDKAYKENKNRSGRCANRAAFSSVNVMFRFRYIPDVVVTSAEQIVCDGKKYKILSVENSCS